MSNPLELLIELQKIESEAGRLSAMERELPARVKALEETFETLRATVEAERGRLEELRRLRREKDGQLRTGQESLKRTRERLFEVKTNKEYQSMLKEIESFEAKNSRIEDEILALLDDLERIETAVKDQDAELEMKRRDFEARKEELVRELSALAGQLAGCIQKGEALKQELPADVLRRYQQIKGIGRGLAVVPVWKEVCGGCYMSIPPQLYNELQKSSGLLTCPNCNRIMYWKGRCEGQGEEKGSE